MNKVVKKIGQSILLALITIVVWAIAVLNTGLYEALLLKQLILLAGIALIVRLWFVGWNDRSVPGRESPKPEPNEQPHKSQVETAKPKEIREFENLKNNGIISDETFNEVKNQILNRKQQ